MKTCSSCKVEKFYKEFNIDKSRKDGYHTQCKSCRSLKSKKNYKLNIEKIKKYREINKEKIKEFSKKYYEVNKEKIKVNKKNSYEKIKEQQKEYRQKNKEKIKEWHKLNREKRNIQQKNRRKKDFVFRFRHNVRSLISNSFKRGTNQFTKKAKSEKILGCTIEEFTLFIKSKFIKGMTLENHGEWHLDHIIPLDSAKSEEEIIKLNHYTNFQPLWAEDNIRKGNRLDY